MRVELVKIGFQKQFMVVHQIKSLIYILYDTKTLHISKLVVGFTI